MHCFQKFLTTNNIEINELFWKEDEHNNAFSYQLMANCIYNELKL